VLEEVVTVNKIQIFLIKNERSNENALKVEHVSKELNKRWHVSLIFSYKEIEKVSVYRRKEKSI
jgi:hypothetical protein